MLMRRQRRLRRVRTISRSLLTPSCSPETARLGRSDPPPQHQEIAQKNKIRPPGVRHEHRQGPNELPAGSFDVELEFDVPPAPMPETDPLGKRRAVYWGAHGRRARAAGAFRSLNHRYCFSRAGL